MDTEHRGESTRVRNLRLLARDVHPGPWAIAPAHDDTGCLVLWSDDSPDAQPIALLYGGWDLARYLMHASPAMLFDDSDEPLP